MPPAIGTADEGRPFVVAYSFRERFIAPITKGLGRELIEGFGAPIPVRADISPKRQTIRAIGRRRHARPGEILQLYYGMRTKQCRSIGVALCTGVKEIRISVEGAKIEILHDIVWHETRTRDGLDEFARNDGFSDWADMQSFWRKEHGNLKHLGPFVGVLIEWEPIR